MVGIIATHVLTIMLVLLARMDLIKFAFVWFVAFMVKIEINLLTNRLNQRLGGDLKLNGEDCCLVFSSSFFYSFQTPSKSQPGFGGLQEQLVSRPERGLQKSPRYTHRNYATVTQNTHIAISQTRPTQENQTILNTCKAAALTISSARLPALVILKSPWQDKRSCFQSSGSSFPFFFTTALI